MSSEAVARVGCEGGELRLSLRLCLLLRQGIRILATHEGNEKLAPEGTRGVDTELIGQGLLGGVNRRAEDRRFHGVAHGTTAAVLQLPREHRIGAAGVL